jgi:hypothetical protein
MNTHGHAGVGKLESTAGTNRRAVTADRRNLTEKIIFTGTKMIFLGIKMILCPNKMKNLPEKMIFPGMIFIFIPVGRVFFPEKINLSPGKIVFPGRKMKIIGVNPRIIGIKRGITGINRATIPEKIRKAPIKTKNHPKISAHLGTNRGMYPVLWPIKRRGRGNRVKFAMTIPDNLPIDGIFLAAKARRALDAPVQVRFAPPWDVIRQSNRTELVSIVRTEPFPFPFPFPTHLRQLLPQFQFWIRNKLTQSLATRLDVAHKLPFPKCYLPQKFHELPARQAEKHILASNP